MSKETIEIKANEISKFSVAKFIMEKSKVSFRTHEQIYGFTESEIIHLAEELLYIIPQHCKTKIK